MENEWSFGKWIAWCIAFALVLDVIGFVAWGLSGQIPQDNFFIGTITKSIVSLFI